MSWRCGSAHINHTGSGGSTECENHSHKTYTDDPDGTGVQSDVTRAKSTHLEEIKDAINRYRSHYNLSTITDFKNGFTKGNIEKLRNEIDTARKSSFSWTDDPVKDGSCGSSDYTPIRAVHTNELRQNMVNTEDVCYRCDTSCDSYSCACDTDPSCCDSHTSGCSDSCSCDGGGCSDSCSCDGGGCSDSCSCDGYSSCDCHNGCYNNLECSGGGMTCEQTCDSHSDCTCYGGCDNDGCSCNGGCDNDSCSCYGGCDNDSCSCDGYYCGAEYNGCGTHNRVCDRCDTVRNLVGSTT